MSYRFMRVILMFDLPMGTVAQQRAYRYFRKELIRLGFVMIQESIYTKLALHPTAVKIITEKVRNICPQHGLVQVLTVTERQFVSMTTLVGEVQTEVIQSDERVLII